MFFPKITGAVEAPTQTLWHLCARYHLCGCSHNRRTHHSHCVLRRWYLGVNLMKNTKKTGIQKALYQWVLGQKLWNSLPFVCSETNVGGRVISLPFFTAKTKVGQQTGQEITGKYQHWKAMWKKLSNLIFLHHGKAVAQENWIWIYSSLPNRFLCVHLLFVVPFSQRATGYSEDILEIFTYRCTAKCFALKIQSLNDYTLPG